MLSRTSIKLLFAICATVAAVLAIVGVSSAKRLGNGPSLTAGHPIKGSLPRNRPLIVIQLRRGKIVGVTGSALLPGGRRAPKRKVTGGQSANCTVNFTNSTQHVSGKTRARWFGGIGCSRTMFMYGTAYLQESATTIDGVGNRYQGNMNSAVSGRNLTIINAPHPSLYIRHLTNVYFSNAPFTGTIKVVPAKGQVLNAASKCVAATLSGHGVGVHCDLYTNRFS